MNSTLVLEDIAETPTGSRIDDGHVLASVSFIEADGSALTIEASSHDDVEKLLKAAKALGDELDCAHSALGSSVDLRAGYPR